MKHTKGAIAGKIIVHGLLMLMCLTTLVPLVMAISISFTDATVITKTGYRLVPPQFSTMAYEWLFRQPKQIITGYRNSLLITGVGTFLNLLITALIAYPLARPDFKYRRGISRFMFFTMIFNGGMVPNYLLIVRYLGWKDNLLSLMIPAIALPYYVFLMRVMFQEIPHAMIEAAKIDGSSDTGTFFRIILPLSKPAFATVGMMLALMYWNESFNAILYIDSARKYPIQLILANINDIVRQIKQSAAMGSGMTMDVSRLPSDTVMFAMMVVTSLPMVFLFTFLQKYFVKGMTVGAVKG